MSSGPYSVVEIPMKDDAPSFFAIHTGTGVRGPGRNTRIEACKDAAALGVAYSMGWEAAIKAVEGVLNDRKPKA